MDDIYLLRFRIFLNETKWNIYRYAFTCLFLCFFSFQREQIKLDCVVDIVCDTDEELYLVVEDDPFTIFPQASERRRNQIDVENKWLKTRWNDLII